MIRAYKYKAKINKQTEINADECLWLCQQLYNAFLEQRIYAYKHCGVSLNMYQQKRELPGLKERLPEYKKYPSNVFQDVCIRLNKSYQNFFRRLKKSGTKAGFPKFQAFHRYNSFTMSYANGYRMDGMSAKVLHDEKIIPENGVILVSGIGRFKLHSYKKRPLQGRIKTVTLKHDVAGWWVIFSCDEVPEKPLPVTGRQVGLDVGVLSFLADSDGRCVDAPRYFKQAQDKLAEKQQALSKCKKGSNRRRKLIIEIGKAYRKVTNQRMNFLHQISSEYIKNYDLIAVEDLKIGNMTRSASGTVEEPGTNVAAKSGLNKAILDQGWGYLFNFLEYKAESAGRLFTRVNARGTSQECARCGITVKKTLADRVHVCPRCGLYLNRDVNAALVILFRGYALDGISFDRLVLLKSARLRKFVSPDKATITMLPNIGIEGDNYER